MSDFTIESVASGRSYDYESEQQARGDGWIQFGGGEWAHFTECPPGVVHYDEEQHAIVNQFGDTRRCLG